MIECQEKILSEILKNIKEFGGIIGSVEVIYPWGLSDSRVKVSVIFNDVKKELEENLK